MRTPICIIALLITAGIARADSTVWVQPFTEANEQQQPDWLNRTLHQALVDELATQGGVRVASAKTRPADARYVVTAQIQRVNAEIRVTGQVLDTESNKSVGGFKATGTERELFAIQDAIGAQVTKAIAPPTATQPIAAAQQPRIEAPFAPIRFGYEGSDLQQAVKDNRPVRQPPIREYEPPMPTLYPVTQQQPYGYNPGYGYNYGYGYGYPYNGFGYGSVIILNNKSGHGHHGGRPGVDHHGGGHHGGGGTVITSGVPANNGQAIRAVSGFGGKTPPPGVINTIGR